MPTLVGPSSWKDAVSNTVISEMTGFSGCKDRKCHVRVESDPIHYAVTVQHGVHTLSIPFAIQALYPMHEVGERLRRWVDLIHYEEDRPLD